MDAAVAMAAGLNVMEPTSTGIGGDAFALFYRASDRTVHAMNGSGRSPAALTLDAVRKELGAEATELPALHAHSITVPGAAAAWADSVDRWGSGALSLSQILAPAVRLAREGAPIGPITARMWGDAEATLRGTGASGLLVPGEDGAPGRAPRAGEVWRNESLAATMEAVGAGGKAAFYSSSSLIARAVVEAVRSRGGVMTAEDLEAHETDWPEPISTAYGRSRVWECPPNGQGLAALVALNIVEAASGGDAASLGPAERAHVMLCAMRLAFADARRYIADPAAMDVTTEALLSKGYAAERAALIPAFGSGEDAAGVVAGEARHGAPTSGSDTVSFQTVDAAGNAVAYINSNYMGFGSHVEPAGTGFTLQNRGANFSLEAGHPNALGPGKRPYHTIIPCMGTLLADEPAEAAAGADGGVPAGSLLFSASVMGGFMQPQGHLQVVVNLVDLGMEPQAALDAPRFCIASGEVGGAASLEPGFEGAAELEARGHILDGERRGWGRSLFGRGQVIWRDPAGTLWGGSDPRGDGCASGW